MTKFTRTLFLFLSLILMACSPALSAPSAVSVTSDIITKGPWLDARAYKTLAAADAAAVASGKLLVISSQWNTVPSALNANVKVLPGGKLNGNGNVDIPNNFEGAPNCIGANLTVTGLKEARPDWWTKNAAPGTTDMASAINKAIAAISINGTVVITGVNKTLSAIAMKDGIKIVLNGSIVAGNQTDIVDFTGIDDAQWIGGVITGDGVTIGQNGFQLRNSNRNRLVGFHLSNTLNKGVNINATSASAEHSYDNLVAPISITGCSGVSGAGISIVGNEAKKNIISGGKYSGNRLGITVNGAHFNEVIAPNCDDNNEIGFTIDGIVSASGDGGTYNQIFGGSYNNNGDAGYGGIYLGNGSSYNTFYSPVSNTNAGAGIRMTGGSSYTNQGNKFFSPMMTGNAINGATVTWSPHTEFISPAVSSNTGKGIALVHADFAKVIGGVITGNTTTGLTVQSGYTKVLGTEITTNGTIGYEVALGGSADSSGNYIGAGAHVTGNATNFAVTGGLGRIGKDITGTSDQLIVADAGDATYNWSVGRPEVIVFTTPLTASRNLTLSTSAALAGDVVRVVRSAACTGAYNIYVGTSLKTLAAAGSWCEVRFNGTAWVLTASGTL